MHCKRVENEEWGTMDYIDEKLPAENPGRLVLRTRKEVRFSELPFIFSTCEAPDAFHPLTCKTLMYETYETQERDRLVLQIGTGEAGRAMKCAELACKDVKAIDINMGCPLKFSTSNGAGAALLKKPETMRDILTTLRRNLPSEVGVTCKIRLLDNMKDTIELAQAIEKTGVSAFGVHGRNVWQRPRDPAQWDAIKQVVDSVSCPVIANGDIFKYEDFDRIREATGAAAAMAARGAMWNQSIFSKEGLVPPRENLMKLMTKCLEWDHSVNNTKYLARCVLECFLCKHSIAH